MILNKNSKGKCKFTLIELLIVVAIIAILMSILLPSLSKAKKASQRALCLANLKTFNTGAHLFLGDNSSKFPGHLNSADVHQGRSWIGKKGKGPAWPLEVTQKPFNKYIGLTEDGMEAPQMKCPFNDNDLDVYNGVGSSYSGNEYNGWKSLGEKYLATINTPSKVILSTEFGAIAYLSNLNQLYWRQTHYTGEARYPFLKIDGSVNHYKVSNWEGITSQSSNIILNLNYD